MGHITCIKCNSPFTIQWRRKLSFIGLDLMTEFDSPEVRQCCDCECWFDYYDPNIKYKVWEWEG